MSTNQAFINAYRRDAAEPAAPPPAYDRHVTVAAACPTSVENAAAGFVPTAAARAAPPAPPRPKPRREGGAPACQTSVEIAAAVFVPTAAASAAARAPAIGKRPL